MVGMSIGPLNAEQMNIQAPFGGKKATGLGRKFSECVSFFFIRLRELKVYVLIHPGFAGIYRAK